MPRKVFYSFHYTPDNWRASQVRRIGTVEKSAVATDNDWETIKRGGDLAIQRWIDGQVDGRSCGIILIGANTAGRKWINYEITKLWNEGKGVFGVHIHHLRDSDGRQSAKGRNPFAGFTLKIGTVDLSSVVPVYDPPYLDSKEVYGHIETNLERWIESAITTRTNYS